VPEVVRHTYAGIARHTGGPLRVATRTVGPMRWWVVERVLRLLARGKGRELVARFRPYVPYTRVDTVFDNRREAALLAAAGVPLPTPDDFFPRVVDYALRHDFGRRPTAAAREPSQASSAFIVSPADEDERTHHVP
jgi:hypothetical protein